MMNPLHSLSLKAAAQEAVDNMSNTAEKRAQLAANIAVAIPALPTALALGDLAMPWIVDGKNDHQTVENVAKTDVLPHAWTPQPISAEVAIIGGSVLLLATAVKIGLHGALKGRQKRIKSAADQWDSRWTNWVNTTG